MTLLRNQKQRPLGYIPAPATASGAARSQPLRWSHHATTACHPSPFYLRTTLPALRTFQRPMALRLIAQAMTELLLCLDANDLGKTNEAFVFLGKLFASLPCIADESVPEEDIPEQHRCDGGRWGTRWVGRDAGVVRVRVV